MLKLEAQQQIASYAMQIANMIQLLASGTLAKRKQECVVRTIKVLQQEIKTLEKIK